MSIRLRRVDGALLAFCAVETDPKPGDVYLDDEAHYALADKFRRDWCGNGLMPGGPMPSDPLRDREEVRDAKEEMEKWDLARQQCMEVNGPNWEAVFYEQMGAT